MLAQFLLTIVIASATTDDQAVGAGLISRLAAPSFDDRVTAIKDLELLGNAALPALRIAASSNDPRIRSRARALIESIGRQTDTYRLTKPTMIWLNFHNRPLGEVVDAINDRHDLRLSLRLDPPARHGMIGILADPNRANRMTDLKARAITLESHEPVPFWDAIDRLCQSGDLYYDTHPAQPFGPDLGSFLLIAHRTAHGPIADFGPFRVQITGIAVDFDRDFVNGGEQAAGHARPSGAGELTVSLLAMAEPGLKLELNGAPTVTEAVDDQGRSLVPADRAQLDPSRPAPGIRLNGGAPMVRIALVVIDPTVKLIRRLKGTIPVIAETKVSNPIVVALQVKSALGKPISTSNMTLVIDDISATIQNRPSVRVTIRPNRDGLAPRTGAAPRRPNAATFNRGDVLQHLELYDAAGKRVNAVLGEQTTGGDSQGRFSRYRLVVAPDNNDGVVNGPAAANLPVPTEFRYYDFVQTATEIPFDFHEVPMP